MALAQKQEELPPKQLQAPFSSAEFTIVTELDRGATFSSVRTSWKRKGEPGFSRRTFVLQKHFAVRTGLNQVHLSEPLPIERAVRDF